MVVDQVIVYGYSLSYAHGEYSMSGGRTSVEHESTVVRIITDDGVEGWGEVAPLAGNYLPFDTGSVRSSLRALAPSLIGRDPCNLNAIHQVMDGTLMGQASAKSAIDIACWDVLGKSVNRPVFALLGGKLIESFPLYFAVPLSEPAEMREFVQARCEEGTRAFQIKVGNSPADDIRRLEAVVEAAPTGCTLVADANGGWDLLDAQVVTRALQNMPVYLEQPCRSTMDCSLIQRHSSLPLILDESVVTASDVFDARFVAKASAVNIKLSRVGGISGAFRMRDLAQGLGMKVTIEDTWGGDLVTAAVSHLAASTLPISLLSTSFFNDWTNEHIAGYTPRSRSGRGSAPDGPGLGVDVDVELLGEPLFSC